MLVQGFGKPGCRTAPGPGASVAGLRPASFAQKLWRFCTNPRVREPDLIEPLHAAIRQQAAATPGVLLAVHDWSTLSFGRHPSKADRATLTHARDLGYDLATVLIVRGDTGEPVAPAAVTLCTADAVYSTCATPSPPGTPHIDQILPAMQQVHACGFGPEVVHVIDREADSAAHWRRWSAEGHLAVVRADDRQVRCQDQPTTLRAVAAGLHRDGQMHEAGAVSYRGRPGRLLVAEAAVVLHRPGTRNVGRKKQVIPGEPLPLRLVVAEVRDRQDRVLARWLLLSNVPPRLGDAATVARWYYYRWRIEGLHKLLKTAGWQVEGWQQRDGQRVLKKLLLALAACVSLWALQRRHDTQSQAFQALLMQLGGRQTKPGRPVTTSGMLAGLWVLQSALGPLARHGPETLQAMLAEHLPLFAQKT